MDVHPELLAQWESVVNRRPMFRPGDAVAAGVAARIATYRPNLDPADLAVWDEFLGDQVREWVTHLNPGGPEPARDTLSYVSRFALWAYREYGELRTPHVFSPQVVGFWINQVNADRSAAWRATARSRLEAAGVVLAPRSGWPAKPVTIGKRRPAVPYSTVEERVLFDAAVTRHDHLRYRALGVVALSLGAGLDGRVVCTVTVGDVVDLGDGRLGVRARSGDDTLLIPVRRRYTALLAEARDLCPGDRLLGTRPQDRNAANNAAHLIRTGDVRLNLWRARATFMVRHLQHGTPIPVLLDLLGTSSVTALIDLARHLDTADPIDTIRKVLDVE